MLHVTCHNVKPVTPSPSPPPLPPPPPPPPPPPLPPREAPPGLEKDYGVTDYGLQITQNVLNMHNRIATAFPNCPYVRINLRTDTVTVDVNMHDLKH